jgi:branched-subunit amino acid aminotransferase/4-amino-4-deoxychorismate lyase
VTRTGGELPVWIDGRLVLSTDAVVSALDMGLRSGLGVFETLRAHGTRTLAADRHTDRLIRGATRLGILVDREEVDGALRAILAAPRSVDQVVVRVTLTAGPLDTSSDWPPAPAGRPTLIVSLHPAPPLPLPPASAATTLARRWPADVKSTSYVASLLANAEARASGADLAVLIDEEDLLETAEGNLFAILDGTLVTPPDDGRLLPGITRELVVEIAEDRGIPTRTGTLRMTDLSRIAALAASSSVAGLRTILSIDGVMPGGGGATNGAEHSMFVELRGALQDRFEAAAG